MPPREIDEDRTFAATLGASSEILALPFRPSLDQADLTLRLCSLGPAFAYLNVDQIIERAQCKIEKIDILANSLRKQARCQREAARNAVDRGARFGEERRYLRGRRLGSHLTRSPSGVTVFPVALAAARGVEMSGPR